MAVLEKLQGRVSCCWPACLPRQIGSAVRVAHLLSKACHILAQLAQGWAMGFFQVFAFCSQELWCQVVSETHLEQDKVNVTLVVVLGSPSEESGCEAVHHQKASKLGISHVLENPGNLLRPRCLGHCGLQERDRFPNWSVRSFFRQDHVQDSRQAQGTVHDKTSVVDESWTALYHDQENLDW